MVLIKKHLILLIILSSISISSVFAISSCSITGGEFVCFSNHGIKTFIVTDNGTIVTGGNVALPNYSGNANTIFTTHSNTLISSGFGGSIDKMYQLSKYGSGIRVTADIYLYNDKGRMYPNDPTTGVQTAIYRSFIGIPSAGHSIPSNDTLMAITPGLGPQTNYISAPMQTTDLAVTNQTQYYYIAISNTGYGNVTMASSSSIHLEIN